MDAGRPRFQRVALLRWERQVRWVPPGAWEGSGGGPIPSRAQGCQLLGLAPMVGARGWGEVSCTPTPNQGRHMPLTQPSTARPFQQPPGLSQGSRPPGSRPRPAHPETSPQPPHPPRAPSSTHAPQATRPHIPHTHRARSASLAETEATKRPRGRNQGEKGRRGSGEPRRGGAAC